MGAAAKQAGEGLVLEFGVFAGESITRLAKLFRRTVWGFDTFTGMPEPWVADDGTVRLKVGEFNLGGEPRSAPANVRFVKGLIQETLPGFLAERPEPWAFVHIDTDTYSPAATILRLGRIGQGTVLLFDELWREDDYGNEYRALTEWLEATGNRVRPIAQYHDKVAFVVA